MSKTKISIIVPNYNHAHFLRRRLDSIFKQTYTDFDVILLDDCSTDTSIELLNEYALSPQVSHYLINSKNSGSPFKQWKKGIELARGEYLWIAETDDESDIHFLEKLLPILEQDTSLGLAFCNSHWIDDTSQIQKDLSIYQHSFKQIGKEEIRNKLVFYNTIQNVSSVLFRRRVFDDIPVSCFDYLSCGDWIIYTTILLSNNFYFLGEKLNYFRWYHNNVSNKSAKNGLWIYEGIDNLALSQKKIKFTKNEKENIIQQWLAKIKMFRGIKCWIMIVKLIRFSPYLFFKNRFRWQ